MKKLKLYSNTKLISDKLIELENNQKTYNRLLQASRPIISCTSPVTLAFKREKI